MTIITRLQTATLFRYGVVVSFQPIVIDEKASVTVFLNEVGNINLGIVMLRADATTNAATNSILVSHFRFLVSGLGSKQKYIPTPAVRPVPKSSLRNPIRLSIRADNAIYYTLYTASSSDTDIPYELGHAPTTIVSRGVGTFTSKNWELRPLSPFQIINILH
jgi:hypothetical protein